MAPALLLGLDVGTTAVKAAVIDADGREVAHGRAATPWREVPTGAEADPDALLHAAARAGAEALRDAPDGELAGVGVAGMAETGVLLDARGRPAVPSIAWHDTRGELEAARLAADLGEHDFAAHTGLPPSRLCTLAKYAWMRTHVPEAENGVRWLNVAEWVVRGLGGEEAAELSLASRTGFYDLHERAPWDEALDWAGAPRGLAPDAVPAGEGDVLDSCGTAEAFVRAVAPLTPEAVERSVALGVSVGWHAVEGRQALLGAVWAGSALARVLALLGIDVEERGAIEAAALDADPGSLRVDGFDAEALTLRGVDRDASPPALYRAALEAVGEAGADVLRRMAQVAGEPARRLVVTGGWASGAAARAVKRERLGAFEHSPAISTGARGAALAAGRAAGLWNSDDAPRPYGAIQEVT